MDEENETDIDIAMRKLDHGDDAHWTKDGKPNLNVVSEYCGRRVKREEIPEIYARAPLEAPKAGDPPVGTAVPTQADEVIDTTTPQPQFSAMGRACRDFMIAFEQRGAGSWSMSIQNAAKAIRKELSK